MAYDFPTNPTNGQAANGYTWNGYAWAVVPVGDGGGTGGAGVTDGDKGDIIVSGTGTSWMLDPVVVTLAAKTVLDDTTVANMRTTLGAEPTIAGGTTAQYWRGDKSWQTLPAAGQPLDATLTALAALNTTPGLVEQTGTDTFAKRGITVSTSAPTGGADGDLWFKV